jgi:uncharacterized protein (DUF58 family)
VPVPTRRLALVAVVASAAVLALSLPSPWSLVVVNAVLLALAALDAVLALDPDAVPIERHVPDVLALGGSGTVTWRIDNPSDRTLVLVFADELVPSLGAAARGTRVTIPALGQTVAETTITPTRRGRFDLAALAVRVTGPLGLASRQSTRVQPDVVRVYPPFRSRDEAELRIDKARLLEGGLRSAKGRGGGTEFDQLREYSVDDVFKRIDWAATARLGKAVVRTYKAERNQTVVNLLDNGRVMAGRVDEVPRVEHAMDAVMMLTAVATRLGDRAGLVMFDRTVRAVVPPGHRADQLGRVTEAMYAVEPALAESDYRGAFTETLARFRRRTMLVIYTDLVEQAVGESLLPALPLIVRHHLVVIAAVSDPAVERWAAASPDDATGAYRKASAIAARGERRRTTARLRGLGATVVDAPPGKLAPLLADTYLKVKATGRL